jgi:hypothetical protein
LSTPVQAEEEDIKSDKAPKVQQKTVQVRKRYFCKLSEQLFRIVNVE